MFPSQYLLIYYENRVWKVVPPTFLCVKKPYLFLKGYS